MSAFTVAPSILSGNNPVQDIVVSPVGAFDLTGVTSWALSDSGTSQPLLQGGVTVNGNGTLTLVPSDSGYGAIQVINQQGYVWLGVGQVLVSVSTAPILTFESNSTDITFSPSSVSPGGSIVISGNALDLSVVTGISASLSSTLPPLGWGAPGIYDGATNTITLSPIDAALANHYLWFLGPNGVYGVTSETIGITPPCFKEDSKILTDKGYVTVQNLKKGDLVKTSKNGFKPIALLGKSKLEHHANEDRIVNQLYNLSKKQYPDLFEDLVLTGAHAVLVDSFDGEQQKEATVEVLGRVFVTDSKYRLPACVDKRASVYKETGLHTIYHLALENDNYYGNYGIYANGLLVESCSKRFLKEISGMTLIE